jgi:hypothetical protein
MHKSGQWFQCARFFQRRDLAEVVGAPGIHFTPLCYSKFADQLRNETKEKTVCRGYFWKAVQIIRSRGAFMFFVIVGAAAGVFLALRRYPVFSLVPVVAIFVAGAIVTGIAAGYDPRTIGIEILGSVVSPQLTYIAASVAAYLIRFSRLLPCVQAAIARELGTAFEVPRALPPEMAALLTKLEYA